MSYWCNTNSPYTLRSLLASSLWITIHHSNKVNDANHSFMALTGSGKADIKSRSVEIATEWNLKVYWSSNPFLIVCEEAEIQSNLYVYNGIICENIYFTTLVMVTATYVIQQTCLICNKFLTNLWHILLILLLTVAMKASYTSVCTVIGFVIVSDRLSTLKNIECFMWPTSNRCHQCFSIKKCFFSWKWPS